MAAEKNEELARTRQYDYKESYRDGERTIEVVRRREYSKAWIWVLSGVVTGLIIGMLGFLIWVCTGIWEDLGYVMEYGVGWYEEDAGGMDVLNGEDAGLDGGEGLQRVE